MNTLKLLSIFFILTIPLCSFALEPDYITYSLNNNMVYRVAAVENATPVNISEVLDSFSPRKNDIQLNISPNGKWMVLRTQRFDDACNGWPCLAVISGDLTSASLIRVNNHVIHPESLSAISSDGKLIVYVGDNGPHSRDLFAVRCVDNVWQSPLLLTGDSTYSLHDMPALADDGSKVIFDCDNDNSNVGEAICEVHTDGSAFRVAFTPEQGPGPLYNPLHSPDYGPNGSIIFEADWSVESVWRLAAGSSTPVRISPSGNDNSPCVLSNGKIASLWLPNAMHEIKVMSEDGGSHFMLSHGVDIFDIGLGCTSVPDDGDNQPPTVPQNLTATVVSASRINLSWHASTDNIGVNGYKIYRDGNVIATPASTTFSDIGLTAATSYSYTVSAYDTAGNNSAQSGSISATTAPPPGDVTNDGQVDLKDAISALLVISGSANTSVNIGGDINHDNHIGLTEAIFILNSMAN